MSNAGKNLSLGPVFATPYWMLALALGLAMHGVACASAGSVANAPSIDPSYGLPLPANVKESQTKAPDWIWASTVSAHQSIYLRKNLKLAVVPPHPVLYVTADNYFSVRATMPYPDPIQPMKKQGTHDDMMESGIARIAFNPANILKKPCGHIADEHQMILGIHGWIGRIAIPEFPYRSGTMPDHITPTGISRLIEHVPCHLGLADLR